MRQMNKSKPGGSNNFTLLRKAFIKKIVKNKLYMYNDIIEQNKFREFIQHLNYVESSGFKK